MTRSPNDVRMLMIDPKMVELSPYKNLPHLMHPVVTDMRKAEAIFGWAVEKMEERYALLARAGVRHISVYNQLGEEELMDRMRPESDEERAAIPRHLPYIVIVADEIADLMMTAAKEVEQHIIRLAQKSRAVGIHLVLATQKPRSTSSPALSNPICQPAFASRWPAAPTAASSSTKWAPKSSLATATCCSCSPAPARCSEGRALTYPTTKSIVCSIASAPTNLNLLPSSSNSSPPLPAKATMPTSQKRDELYEQAIDVVIREGRGSVSLLQRALGIGYGRAARLIDFMAEDGIVGEYNGFPSSRSVGHARPMGRHVGSSRLGRARPPPQNFIFFINFFINHCVSNRPNCTTPDSSERRFHSQNQTQSNSSRSGRRTARARG